MRAKSLWSYLILCNPMDCSLPGSPVHGDSTGKNTEMGCHALLQGTSLTQGLNLCLLHLLPCQMGTLPTWEAPTVTCGISFSTELKDAN